MIIRTIAYVLLIIWLSMLSYVIFFINDDGLQYNNSNTHVSHNALSGNSLGNLQSRKIFRSRLTEVSMQINHNGNVASHKSDNYNISGLKRQRVYESNKTYHSNINYSPIVSQYNGAKYNRKSKETATAIAPLSFPKFSLLMQPSYEHYSERKPFDNEQASIVGRQRAPFESDPDFPSDPGDMGAPIGPGNWMLIILGWIYGCTKYLLKQRKNK
jgi:hypothetical protein